MTGLSSLAREPDRARRPVMEWSDDRLWQLGFAAPNGTPLDGDVALRYSEGSIVLRVAEPGERIYEAIRGGTSEASGSGA